jgi:hypothetical protein
MLCGPQGTPCSWSCLWLEGSWACPWRSAGSAGFRSVRACPLGGTFRPLWPAHSGRSHSALRLWAPVYGDGGLHWAELCPTRLPRCCLAASKLLLWSHRQALLTCALSQSAAAVHSVASVGIGIVGGFLPYLAWRCHTSSALLCVFVGGVSRAQQQPAPNSPSYDVTAACDLGDGRGARGVDLCNARGCVLAQDDIGFGGEGARRAVGGRCRWDSCRRAGAINAFTNKFNYGMTFACATLLWPTFLLLRPRAVGARAGGPQAMRVTRSSSAA